MNTKHTSGQFDEHVALCDEARRIARLESERADLLAALEIMVRAFNADEIDPLVAFASIEKARAAIAKARA